jgi:flagellar basal body-associated protein FliL
MKPKEIIQIVVALVFFSAAGFLIFMQLGHKSASKSPKKVTYDKITPIPDGFNTDAIDKLSDGTKYRDFYSQPDLKSGLDNTQPFGPLR